MKLASVTTFGAILSTAPPHSTSHHIVHESTQLNKPAHWVSTDTTAAPEATCTMQVFKPPPLEENCVFHESTRTITHWTDCGGCELRTRKMGVGLVSTVLHLLGWDPDCVLFVLLML
jgi:hypothetical protein